MRNGGTVKFKLCSGKCEPNGGRAARGAAYSSFIVKTPTGRPSRICI